MIVPDYAGIIPQQYTGKEITADAVVELPGAAAAIVFYHTAKDRLLNVNNWHKIAGMVSSQFQLFDPDGIEVKRKVAQGDYIRIDIPGPGSHEGDGYDWVVVEELKEISDAGINCINFRVRPSANPHGNKGDIAHFYHGEATSNFMIIREGSKITASIIDRNIKPNDDTTSFTDKLRHTAVGMSAITGFSKIQWQHLANAFVKSAPGFTF